MKLTPFSRYKIAGHSMEPTFKENEVVWVYTWAYLFNRPKIGDIIIFEFEGKELIKKVALLDGSSATVVGDNSADSLDSNTIGKIAFKQIKGKVLTKNKQG